VKTAVQFEIDQGVPCTYKTYPQPGSQTRNYIVQVWSLTEREVDVDGRNAYSLPEWVVKWGGLKPVEPLTCGGIFIDTPQLDIRVDSVIR
jgi:hypothetical protein